MEVNLIGDSKETLRALILHLICRRTARGGRRSRARSPAGWKILENQATQDAEPLNPQRLFHKLSPRLPEGCNVTDDSGSATNWWARHLTLREDLTATLSGTVATIEPAAVYVLDAKFAHPDRPMIATLGDGTSRCSASTRW